ncbi:MAG TPA: penicillin acylase family protein [Pyrinomonadaceae bacterium]
MKTKCAALLLLFLLSLSVVDVQAQNAAVEKLQVRGLAQPVEILRDRWGVSHIYAENEADLFFAQGYNVARDRMFQLELWRRQATGTVSEFLGRKALKRDTGTRLFLFRGDLKQELNWYHPHGEIIINAFVNGINAYIDETVSNSNLLSPEFKMLGIKPGKWTPAVVISRFNGLLANVTQELTLAQAVRVLGPDRVNDLEYFQPANPKLEIDPAIDQTLLTRSVLDLYNAFREPIRFTPDDLMPEYRGSAKAKVLVDDSTVVSAIDLSQRLEDIGSNNWVVSGKLTPSGFPMMMNDPHRAQSVPSLRYWVHLVAPGWNVIGAGEPALPGVSIGHNEFGAWGLTIFGGDSEDLYVYDLNPANATQYKYRGKWEDMRVIRESVAIEGEAPAAIELRYTRHGPVVHLDQEHHKAYAVRAAWMEIGSAPYLASLRMDQAHSWSEFREACSYSFIPSENMVWADRNGNIGYQAVGISPLRPGWSGLVPVPGDGRFEWGGFLPIKELPNVLNPEKGFWNTSNNYLIPAGWPHKDALHYSWADPYRASRVAEVLASGQLFTVAEMVRLQNDDLSIPARSLVPLLQNLSFTDQATAKARDRLIEWNYVLDKESVPAGIYEMWQRRIQINMRELLVPKEAQAFIGNLNMKRIIDRLYAPDGRFGTDPVAGRNNLLTKSLTEAVAELDRRFGADTEKWKLGAYHHALIRHPLEAALKPELRAKFNVGDKPRGGDSYTVTATAGGDNQTSGGSFKIIVDTEDWDTALGLSNPGQSGDVNDPHYRDLYELWSVGKYFPIFYSRKKIETVTEKVVQLSPATRPVRPSAAKVRN